MDLSKNFSFELLNIIGRMVGGTVQFRSEHEAILVDSEGREIARFLGMRVLRVEGKELNNIAMRSGQAIANFIIRGGK